MLNIDGKLQTRCGLPVTLLVRDLKGPFPLGGIIHNVVDFKKEEKEIVRGWKLNGRYLDIDEDHPYDLVNVKQKKEGYIVVRMKDFHREFYSSKEAAERTQKYLKDETVLLKVEWFE